MPWVITKLCIDCLDTGCVSVCPVDCIYEPLKPGKDGLAMAVGKARRGGRR